MSDIRKRVMHTIRTLEETDLSKLVETATRIVNEVLGVNWSQIKQALIQQASGSFGDLGIFVLPNFDIGSAVRLFRSLANAYNYRSLLELPHDEVHRYCGQLNNRPLLIKWFVHAVAGGADPGSLPTGDDYQEALRFCYENVYQRLSESARQAASVMLASRAELSRAQLQDLLGIDHVAFQFVIQSLLRSSMTDQVRAQDGSSKFKIDGLVRDYFSRNHPPDNKTVTRVRKAIREWIDLRQETAMRSRAHRYEPGLINVNNVDEQVAQRYLRSALAYSYARNFQSATEALDTADRLTPDWWEVPRIRAKILIDQNAPLYDIEEQFEKAVALTTSDVPRYFYSTFLINNSEYHRAIEQINVALDHPDAAKEFLLSQRGRANARLARLDEAITDFSQVIEIGQQTSYTSDRTSRINETQLADIYRRVAEQAILAGDQRKTVESLLQAAAVLDNAMSQYGVDSKIALALIEVAGEASVVLVMGTPEFDQFFDTCSQQSGHGSTIDFPEIIYYQLGSQNYMMLFAVWMPMPLTKLRCKWMIIL